MEEDQEVKHVCKMCNRSFRCGRSLGGHMRSHLINSTQTHHKNGVTNAFIDTGYELREHTKKTYRFSGLVEDTLLYDKLCKECGKGFQSYKALFGHMKCHSVKFSTATTTSSVSEMEQEQEQEEVAMCLMMLSRGMGHWEGDLNFVGDDSSDFSEANLVITKTEGKNSVCSSGKVFKKFKKLRNGNLDPTLLDRESEFGSKRSETPVCDFVGNGKPKKSKVEEEFKLEKNFLKGSEFDQAELGSRKYDPSKRKGFGLFDPEMGEGQSSKLEYGTSDSDEVYSDKKSKFECVTCNKTFHSYQALGGHRASHKKLKGCFSSKTDGYENSNETDQLSSNPIDYEMVDTSYFSKKSKTHECPICLRVFTSGQALGGHKRSHLVNGGYEAKSNQIGIETQKTVPEIRVFLDLNTPAPVEEENSFKPWRVESNHKHETLIGLLTS